MTNYVIINGTNSNTITGLAINELPPITKPLMRTEKEEIDGRDGDIITKLGYSAYDKTITIGLWGTGYDVNSIISFFNKEGTITFSNEADKYYNFTMLEQFDIESLLRFKTASITFHCQPFKYPLTETPIEIQYEYIEQDNVESASLNNTNGNTHLDISLKGNTSQTGTPTPSTPIPVNVVSGDNTITISNSDNTQSQTYPIDLIISKNLYDKSKPNILNAWFPSSQGKMVSSTDYSIYIKIKPNTTYTVSKGLNSTTADNRFNVGTCVDIPANGVSLTNTQTNSDGTTKTSETITSGVNDKYLIVFLAKDETCFNELYGTIQIEEGSSASPYEDYNSIELCKIGDYQDYFTKNSDGQWCKYNAIGKVVLDGSENWPSDGGTQGTDYRHNIQMARLSIPTPISINSTYLSNYFVARNIASDIGELGSFYISNTWLVFVDKNKVYDLDQWKTWLSNNNTTVYYVLATPYLSLIEDTTLIEQLDNIQNAMSYEGQTNVSQVNNDKPFIMDLIAMKDGTDEVVVNNIGNIYSKPTIALEGTGDINIYLDGTQMLKATLTDKMTIDTNNLEAYNPDTMTLLNRQLVGDISKFTLASGNNTIKVDGNLTKATITNYTRWL